MSLQTIGTSGPPGPTGATGPRGQPGPPGAPGPAGGFAIQGVTGPATISATANTQYNVDVSGGAVVINLPTLTGSQGVKVKHVNGSLTANALTVNAPAGGTTLDQPVPYNGTRTTSFVLNSDAEYGTGLTWWNYGVLVGGNSVYSVD